MAQCDFDTKKVPDYDTLPAGDYECVIESVTIKSWDDGDQYFSILLSILSGKFQGRKLFDSPTYASRDEESEKMKYGQRRIKQLCLAVGLERISDTDQLVNRSLVAKVNVYKPKDESKEPRNAVSRYLPRDGVSLVKPTPSHAGPSAAASVPSVVLASPAAQPESLDPVTDCPF